MSKEIELIENLGHTVEKKIITLEILSKGGVVILGTPDLTNAELNELIGVCHHQREVNVKKERR